MFLAWCLRHLSASHERMLEMEVKSDGFGQVYSLEEQS